MRYLPIFVIIALSWPFALLLTEPARLATPVVATAYWASRDQDAERDAIIVLAQSWTPTALAGLPPKDLAFPAVPARVEPCISKADPCDNSAMTAVVYAAVGDWLLSAPGDAERDLQVRISTTSYRTQTRTAVLGSVSTVVTVHWLSSIGVRVTDSSRGLLPR